MKRLALAFTLASLLALAISSPAHAVFGFEEFDVAFTDSQGKAVSQAGSHPHQMEVSLRFQRVPDGKGGEMLDEAPKDILVEQARGWAGNPTATPRCSTAEFLTGVSVKGVIVPDCPDASAVGTASATLATSAGEGGANYGALYNLDPPPGVAARLGFWVLSVPVTIEAGLKETSPYNITAGPTNVSQILEVVASTLTLWGTPAAEAHDPLRGHCLGLAGESLGECPASITPTPFITMPRSCTGPLQTNYRIRSWQNPGAWIEGFAESQELGGCGKLDFGPEVGVEPSTAQAESSAGLGVSIDIADEGLANPDGIAKADIEEVRLALPAGMTVNPSAAEGLGVCTLAQYEAASLAVKGCPESSKLGSLEADTPLLENHTLKGSFYLAAQDDPTAAGKENPFDSLLAAYILIRDEDLGVMVKQAAEIETDPETGQIVTTVADVPPYPLERVRVNLRSGPRAPLITPPACGTYRSEVTLTPSSGAEPLVREPSFEIDSGPNGSPCPPAGAPPFDPGFEAGTLNNAAGSFSPFAMRLTRADGDQDLTKFSATLPPGVVGRIAGVSQCSDAAIAQAKAKSGRQEQASPSCPAGSKIGSVLAGAGVGTSLTWAGGSLYLSGPYNGAPLSVAAIVPAVAGPFDVGTVVTRVALKLNPVSAQVEVDGAASDPIPHILEGIPLKVRDVRVATDRPSFTLNPTSCDPYETVAEIFGSGTEVFNPADDSPIARDTRFQASSCASLGFSPKLRFRLKGGVKRGGHPAFKATYTPRAGDANLEGLVVRLPRSAFLDQGHIRTICTRVQFAADACPPGARYGFIKATTPLLDEPLQGPVWLRSSDHNLPDLVFDLQGIVDIEVATRIDSKNGGIRASIEGAPDAPITKVELTMQGAKKGLIVNSRNLCAKPSKANVRLVAHNGKASSARPVLRAAGCKGKGRKAKRAKRRLRSR